MREADLIVVGGGPAGLAAAIEARECGVKDIVVIERDQELGGILQQCIHPGFGLKIFKEELTGPEYADRFIEQLKSKNIQYMLNTMVIDITRERVVTAVNSIDGLIKLKAKAVILAMGCRERTRGALNIPGTRPAGVYTAGTAQRLINMEGYLPGKKVVILGSGDIGLIMARRMTLEGAEVKMVCELMPYSGGLKRNIVQCLDDFDIPLKLSHTVIKVHGNKRVKGVTIAKVDENKKPIPGTEEYVECDTLLLSVGLIPENELSGEAGVEIDPITGGPIVNDLMETSVRGIFACGNVVHVHDLVDNVTEESRIAGRGAAEFISCDLSSLRAAALEDDFYDNTICVKAGKGIRYVVPQKISLEHLTDRTDKYPKNGIKLLFRVKDVYSNARINLMEGGEVIHSIKRIKAAPGEMESMVLTKKLIEKLTTKFNNSDKVEEKKEIVVELLV